jgi:Zn-dependent membrane protease YugP
MVFDPLYFLMIAPAVLLAMWAQGRVRSSYAEASQVPARLSGAAAARHLLDSAGLHHVAIEAVGGELTDHYDPRAKVLRLSQGVYGQRSMAAVGIAAHEAGHAIQDAQNYAPLVLRNLAVPAASAGSGLGLGLLFLGTMLASSPLGRVLVIAGIALFSAVVVFQLINLPVEFDASRRAKRQLVEYGILPAADMQYVNRVLNAAAWTYVAATLQAVLMLLYLLMRLRGGDRS